MTQIKPIHNIRLGSIRAAIWANDNGANNVWFNVTVSRLYKDGNSWKDTNSFGRDDLPIVTKIMDMAYSWIWARQTEPGHAGRSHQHIPDEMANSSRIDQ